MPATYFYREKGMGPVLTHTQMSEDENRETLSCLGDLIARGGHVSGAHVEHRERGKLKLSQSISLRHDRSTGTWKLLGINVPEHGGRVEQEVEVSSFREAVRGLREVSDMLKPDPATLKDIPEDTVVAYNLFDSAYSLPGAERLIDYSRLGERPQRSYGFGHEVD